MTCEWELNCEVTDGICACIHGTSDDGTGVYTCPDDNIYVEEAEECQSSIVCSNM